MLLTTSLKRFKHVLSLKNLWLQDTKNRINKIRKVGYLQVTRKNLKLYTQLVLFLINDIAQREGRDSGCRLFLQMSLIHRDT